MNERICWSPATIVLAAAWLGHTVILFFIEPGMGFRSPADYFDLSKVVPALDSLAWLSSNVLHVVTGFALLQFQLELRSARPEERQLAADIGLVAAPLFVIVGVCGFVGASLGELLRGDASALSTSLYALLVTRTCLLFGAITLLGMMILTFSARRDNAAGWLRLLGLAVGAACILFVVLPAPIPLLLLIWSLALLPGRAPR